MASREVMKTSEVIDCSQLPSLDTALSQVRQESSVLIVATITEFILNNGDCGSIASTIDPVLDSFRSKIFGFCNYRPSLQVHKKYLLDSSPSLYHCLAVRRSSLEPIFSTNFRFSILRSSSL